MSLVLEYRNTRADFLTHYELALASEYLAGRSAHYRSIALWVGVVLLGSYAAYTADQIFLLCLLLALGGLSLAQSVPYSRRYWAAVEQSLATRPETQIRLEVVEDGLHETVQGIQSFVPWASVKRFTVFRDILFIELAAGLCAIVPRRSVSPNPTDLDTLIKLLRERGIEEAPDPTVQRTGASRSGRGEMRTSATAVHWRLAVPMAIGATTACAVWLLIPNQMLGTVVWILIAGCATGLGLIWDKSCR